MALPKTQSIPDTQLDQIDNTRITNVLWWTLWLSACALLTFHFRNQEGIRDTLPFGQYIYFGITVFAIGLLSTKLPYAHAIRDNPYPATTIIFLCSSLGLSSLFGIDSAFGLRLLLILIVTSFPFLLIGYYSAIRPSSHNVSPILYSAVFAALGAWILNLTGPITILGFDVENYLHDQWRWSFLFEEANGLAWFLVMGLSAVLYKITAVKSVRTRTLGIVVFLPVFLFVFYYTNSRASLLWLLSVFLLYALLYITGSKSFKLRSGTLYVVAVFSIFLCLIALVLSWDSISHHLRLGGTNITSGRFDVWLLFLNEFKQNPLFGFGFGATSIITEDISVKSPLNVYIGILGEAGLFGLTSLGLLWIGAIYRSWIQVTQRWKSRDPVFHYSYFIMAMLIGMATQQIGEWNILRVSLFNFLFFYLIGAAYGLGKENDKNRI